MTYKAMYKNELADAAGVSLHTFYKWLQPHAATLRQMGVTPKTKLLNPAAVRFVCDTFAIDLPDTLK